MCVAKRIENYSDWFTSQESVTAHENKCFERDTPFFDR